MAESGARSGGLSDRLDGLGEMARLCADVGRPVSRSVSFGDPGETRESVESKLEFLDSVSPAFTVLRLGSRGLPNTEGAMAALDEGMIESQSELIKPTFYIAEGVRDWLGDRLREEVAKRPRWNLS